MQQDKEELFRFVNRLADCEFYGAVQVVPYGEAMIHEYYWEALAQLSMLSGVEAVGAQTNLSFPVEKMISVYKEAGGAVKKLRLWGTFHPEMVSLDGFLVSCDKLVQMGVRFCVGSVGVPENIPLLRELRRRLDQSVYLWVNKMDGLRRNYTSEEVMELQEIDEYFQLELRHCSADVTRCKDTILVDGTGMCYPCNICKNSVGNIYETSFSEVFLAKGKMNACGRKECDCYIAYSNRSEIEELVFFHPYPAFRIPNYKKAVFFDVDGTLVYEGEHEISERRAEWLRRLSKHSEIFLATSLPYEEAMRKMKPVASVIRGGVFASGGRLRITGVQEEDSDWEHVESMDERVLDGVSELQKKYDFRVRVYRQGEKVYKIVLRAKTKEIQKAVIEKMAKIRDFCHIITEDNKVEITATGASKLAGVRWVCEKLEISLDDIAVFGNAEADLEMMRAVPFSVAAAGSCEAVKEVAKVVLE